MLFLLGKRWNYEKGMLQFWNSWIFLSQNFSLCLPCICCLTLRRIKQFSNVFVPKTSLKNVNICMENGVWPVYSEHHCINFLTEFFLITVAASIFMPRPLAELELQMNFNAISKNVKILQIGPVEPKLWKIREINVVWLEDHAGGKNHSLMGPLINRWFRKS